MIIQNGYSSVANRATVMIDVLLATAIFSELLAALAVLASILFPAHRIWPPDPPSPWKQFLMGSLFLYPAIGIGVLGILDWGSLEFPSWIRIGFGVPPLIAGLAWFYWALAVLGFDPMFGSEGALAVGGPFRFSRNPQYVGCMWMLIGWTVLASSAAAGIASLFALLPLVLVPFAEEPWLRKRHGAEYEEYVRTVPRFIPLWGKRR